MLRCSISKEKRWSAESAYLIFGSGKKRQPFELVDDRQLVSVTSLEN